jgi:hypothetical protein
MWIDPMGSGVIIRTALPILLLAGIAAHHVHAESPAEAAERWRLPGTWKLDCSQPASRANPSFTFVVRDEKLYQTRDLGDLQDANPVTDAAINLDGDLETTLLFPTMARQVVQRKQSDDRYVVWSNRDAFADSYSIKDGHMANGAPAPVLSRCR